MVTMVTVSGTIHTPQGAAAVGQVAFIMPAPLLDDAGNIVVAQSALRSLLDINGAFSIDLPACNVPGVTPFNWTYEADVMLSGNNHISGSLFVDAVNEISGQDFASTFEPDVSPTLGVNPLVVVLDDAPTIAINAHSGQKFTVTLAGNRTLGNPVNSVDGMELLIEIVQDSTGGRTLALGTNYNNPNNLLAGMSTLAGKRSYLTVRYKASVVAWDVVDFRTGY